MLREGDSLPYLRFKQSLLEADHQAVYHSGKILPVWIRKADSKLFVETDNYTWVEPTALPGFVRLELLPEERAKREEKTQHRADATSKPKDFRELQERAQHSARNYLASRQAANRQQCLEQSDLKAELQVLSELNRQDAQINAQRKGQR